MTKEVSLTEGGSQVFVSTRSIYVASSSGQTYGQCQEDKCRYTLAWNLAEANSACNFKAVCSELNGHICGDYGLTLQISGQEEQDICHVNAIHQGTVAPGGRAALELWVAGGVEQVDFNCFAWCSQDGKWPQALPNASRIGDQILELAVSLYD